MAHILFLGPDLPHTEQELTLSAVLHKSLMDDAMEILKRLELTGITGLSAPTAP